MGVFLTTSVISVTTALWRSFTIITVQLQYSVQQVVDSVLYGLMGHVKMWSVEGCSFVDVTSSGSEQSPSIALHDHPPPSSRPPRHAALPAGPQYAVPNHFSC